MGSSSRSFISKTTTMKLTAIIGAIVALAGLAAGVPQVAVVRDDSVAPVGAVFRTDFALDDGTTYLEEGSPGVEGQTNHAGSYSWTAPNGETFTVEFVADENGFRPVGAHLPARK